jgi:hypothetical protein
MQYELWDHDSGNLLGVYQTEAAALQAVIEAIQNYGRDADEVATLMLGFQDEQGNGGIIAAGAELAELALSQAGPRRASA